MAADAGPHTTLFGLEVTDDTRLIRVFGPFSTRATTKSQPKAPPWRARIGAIALRYCV